MKLNVDKKLQVFLLIITGLVIGFVNGFLGAGGGMLLVPALTLLLGLESKKIHATAVFVIVPICMISGIVYVIKGVFDINVFLPVVVGSVIGGVAGTFLLKKLSNEIISLIFWGLMVFAGVWIVIF